MSLWGGFFAFLRIFIPSFMRSQGRLDEKSSKRGCIQNFRETSPVFDVTNKDISRSAPCNLHVCDSAYDTLHGTFSPNRSVDRGFKSEVSDQKSVDNLSYHLRIPKYTTDDEQNAHFSPVNKHCTDDLSDHVTYSTSQKSRRNESMENNMGLYFSEMQDRKQKSFAENKFTANNRCKSEDLQDLELDQRDSKMKLNFHDKTFDLSQSRTNHNRFRKHKEPDVYNGDNVEWPDYVCHFEQVSLWNEWTDYEKATQLAMCLRGRAQRVLSELTNRELNNYFELKSALTQRFCPAERETAYRCDFRNRRRKSGESVADYGYSLRRLASRAFPAFPLDMRESLTVEQFVTGLGSQELKRYVQFSHPKSLDRAISLALEFESFEGSQDTLRKPRDPEKLPYRQCNALVSPEGNESSNHISNENLEKSIERIVQKALSKYSNKNPDSQTKRTTDLSNVKCFTCKQSGHISKNCPQNQNKGISSKSEFKTGNGNDTCHLNQNGLRSRPQAQPHQNH